MFCFFQILYFSFMCVSADILYSIPLRKKQFIIINKFTWLDLHVFIVGSSNLFFIWIHSLSLIFPTGSRLPRVNGISGRRDWSRWSILRCRHLRRPCRGRLPRLVPCYSASSSCSECLINIFRSNNM